MTDAAHLATPAYWTERAARRRTTDLLAHVDAAQLERRGRFAEYGELTLRGLIHYLCSHDQQHLACMHWLLGRMASQRQSEKR